MHELEDITTTDEAILGRIESLRGAPEHAGRGIRQSLCSDIETSIGLDGD
jgi:hypothetical protein